MMKHRMIAAAVLAATLGIGGAEATPAHFGALGGALRIPDSSAMRDGAISVPPFAAAIFCATYPQECENDTPSRVALDEDTWRTIVEVNARVNARITAQPDPVGIDRWELGKTIGDCDDFAVEKRRELRLRGFPLSALSLAVARIGTGELHLVLVVRTDRGDYVLDNLFRDVRPWTRTGYRWVMRQTNEDPRSWLAIETGRRAPAEDGLTVVAVGGRARPAPEAVARGPALDLRPAIPVVETRADDPMSAVFSNL